MPENKSISELQCGWCGNVFSHKCEEKQRALTFGDEPTEDESAAIKGLIRRNVRGIAGPLSAIFPLEADEVADEQKERCEDAKGNP